MTLILIIGCLLAAKISISDRLSSKDKFMMIVVLGIVCGIATLFSDRF